MSWNNAPTPCPPLRSLQAWVDHRCELEPGAIEHVRSCPICLRFLEQTAQAPELELWRFTIEEKSFRNEPEFSELQARLKDLPGPESSNQTCMDQAAPVLMAIESLASLQACMPDQRYGLIREIGRGGCGIVVLAFDRKLNREVAIKFLVRNSESDKQRLAREGRLLAELDHPNVVRIYDVGEMQGTLNSGMPLYLVMEYVPGGTAAEHRWGTDSTFHELAAMLVGVAEGLHVSHMKGLVHRDLKPGNLLIDLEKRLLKVADFGLAKHLGESATQVTRVGNLVGTPEYMSPEQVVGLLGDGADEQQRSVESPTTDVYSLGATLYALLTGQPPLSGNPLAVLRQIPEVQPVAPSILNPDVPRDLELICQHAMEKLPSRRYASMQEFADDLQRFVDDRPIHAQAPSWWRLSQDWCKRNKALAGALVLLLCTLTAGVVGTTWMWWRASKNALETAKYANSLEANRIRLRESVSRFQQRIFADEAMHWQMTDSFRREMFADVIAYLDEFGELITEPEKEFVQFERLISDFLMISRAAREVGRYEDAIIAADRAMQLMKRHRERQNENAEQPWLYLQYRVANAACRARIPMQSFVLPSSRKEGVSESNPDPCDAEVLLSELVQQCERIVHRAQREIDAGITINIATASDEQFDWLIAKRECVLLGLGCLAQTDSKNLDSAKQVLSDCESELKGTLPGVDQERLLRVGDLGWELAWSLSSQSSSSDRLALLERCESFATNQRSRLRSMEKQLIFSDWELGITLARKSYAQSLSGDLLGAIETAKLASASMDKAIEMRPQNRKWIDESVRLEFLRCDWTLQTNERELANSMMTGLIKKKLRLSKSAPEDYEQRKKIVLLFVKLADMSRESGLLSKAREEYYIAAQDCRIIVMNPPDRNWGMEVRPWLLSQVIALDEDRKFREGPLKQEASFFDFIKKQGLDGQVFQKVLDGEEVPSRPSQLEPTSIFQAILYD